MVPGNAAWALLQVAAVARASSLDNHLAVAPLKAANEVV
jgi:hypothetical protein